MAYEARTTSLPQGEIDAEPTGLFRWTEPSWPKVGLSKAEAGPLGSPKLAIVHVWLQRADSSKESDCRIRYLKLPVH